jgi:hypothetical protein
VEPFPTPGPQGSAGESGITWRGAYDAGLTYAQHDGVTAVRGASYVSLVDGNHGHTPPATRGASDSYWQLVAEIGVAGASGPAPASTGRKVVEVNNGVLVDPATLDPSTLGGTHTSGNLVDLPVTPGAGDTYVATDQSPPLHFDCDVAGTWVLVASGTTAAYARSAIGAGTSSLALGTSAGTALAGDTPLLALGTTSTTALRGDTTIPTVPGVATASAPGLSPALPSLGHFAASDGAGGVVDAAANPTVAAAVRAALGFLAGSEYGRPAAGSAGQSYLSTTCGALYDDVGTAWVVGSNGGGRDAVGLAGFAGGGSPKQLRGTGGGPRKVKGSTFVVAVYVVTASGVQNWIWQSSNATSRGFGFAFGGPTANAFDFVLPGTAGDTVIGTALAAGPHLCAVAIDADGLHYGYSIDGAVAVTGVSIAASTALDANPTDPHAVGLWADLYHPATDIEIHGLAHIPAVLTATQLAQITSGYAELRITTPAGLTEDCALRIAHVSGYGVAAGDQVICTGSLESALTNIGGLTVAPR